MSVFIGSCLGIRYARVWIFQAPRASLRKAVLAIAVYYIPYQWFSLVVVVRRCNHSPYCAPRGIAALGPGQWQDGDAMIHRTALDRPLFYNDVNYSSSWLLPRAWCRIGDRGFPYFIAVLASFTFDASNPRSCKRAFRGPFGRGSKVMPSVVWTPRVSTRRPK